MKMKGRKKAKKPTATEKMKKTPRSKMGFNAEQKRWLRANMMRKKAHRP